MRDLTHVTLTLAIADSAQDFHVVSVSGHDRLNTPFCFEVDLVSTGPRLLNTALLQRSAYLQMGDQAGPLQDIHGRVHALKHLYQGENVSLYRMTLMPALQQLDGTRNRRVFRDLTVFEIIERVLQTYAMPDCNVRFDRIIGIYPPREHCVQYDESDLHFLSRLCEEDGICFRFEHTPHAHTLVFSDDPMSFPEWSDAVPVRHLAERLSARTCYSSHSGANNVPAHVQRWSDQGADAPSLWTPDEQEADPGRRQQTQRRTLERLRCERQDIMGQSSHLSLRSGLVMRVENHPDAHFNDHWLLTEVVHTAWQLAPLRCQPSCDVIHILQAIAFHDSSGAGISRLLAPAPGGGKPLVAHYDNSFQVIPWTMPFRPALQHPKPMALEFNHAVRVANQADGGGRIPIRFNWQTDEDPPCHARVIGNLAQQKTDAVFRVGFLEGDPDQPVVCAVVDDERLDSLTEGDQPDTPRSLHIESQGTLLLKGARATLSISATGILYLPAISDA